MTSPIRPPRLRPGATIGVAAVSGPVDESRLLAGVAALRARGYEVVLAQNALARAGFLAGSDRERADGYRELLRNPGVGAIFFARGGYGSARILQHLEPRDLIERPRIHLGGSDLTALFAFAARAGLVTFYGPMVAGAMAGDEDLDWQSVLSGQTPEAHRVADEDILAGGAGEGPLVGGCLSLAASVAGTPEQIDGQGAVFFWEDVGEEAYRLDRMLTQLERSGTFDRLQAMIIGSISPGARGGESTETAAGWLADRFAGAPFPVVRRFPAGHVPGSRTLPLGIPVRVDAERGVVEFSEAGVT